MPSGRPSRPGAASLMAIIPAAGRPPREPNAHNSGSRGHEEGMTVDASNDPRGDHPLRFSDRERDEIEALRRRFEQDAPQAFTDSDSSRFERITGTLGVPGFPITREAVLDLVRANHGADS